MFFVLFFVSCHTGQVLSELTWGRESASDESTDIQRPGYGHGQS